MDWKNYSVVSHEKVRWNKVVRVIFRQLNDSTICAICADNPAACANPFAWQRGFGNILHFFAILPKNTPTF